MVVGNKSCMPLTEGNKLVRALDRLNLLPMKLEKFFLEVIEIVERKAAGVTFLGERQEADLGRGWTGRFGDDVAGRGQSKRTLAGIPSRKEAIDVLSSKEQKRRLTCCKVKSKEATDVLTRAFSKDWRGSGCMQRLVEMRREGAVTGKSRCQPR